MTKYKRVGLIDKYLVEIIFAISFAYSCLILHRWFVTDLGTFSFGRVWMYYVDYAEIGFQRRSLIGSILSFIGLSDLFENEYVFAYTIHTLCLAALYLIVLIQIKKIKSIESRTRVAAVIAFSPGLFAHLSYATGTFDLILVLLFTIILFWQKSLVLICISVFLGTLIHESFLALVPTIAILKSMNIEELHIRSLISSKFKKISNIFLFSLLPLLLYRFSPSLTEAEHNSIMKNHIPKAYNQMDLWSGFGELHSGTSDNFRIGLKAINFLVRENLIYLILGICYCIFLAFFVTNSSELKSKKVRLLLIFSFNSPLFLQLIAGDFWRWVSLSSIVSLLVMLKLAIEHKFHIRSRTYFFFGLTFFFNPLGASELSDPLPLFTFILERL